MITVLVTGSSGMLGKSLQSVIENTALPSIHFIFLTRTMLDLTDLQAVKDYDFKTINIIIHLAAKCGGLYENMENNYDFYTINNDITKSVLYLCKKYKVSSLVNVLSTCIFPDYTNSNSNSKNQILLESKNILNGPPHDSNSGYSYAKRNLYIESRYLVEKFPKIKIINFIPTNMYGNNDSSSHVIPDLIKKCIIAKENKTDFLIKGSGNAKRQFLFVNDFARILLSSIFKEFTLPITDIIVSPSESYSIKELTQMIIKKVQYTGNVVYDTKFPDGQLVKMSNNQELNKYFKNFKFTSLSTGLELTIQ